VIKTTVLGFGYVLRPLAFPDNLDGFLSALDDSFDSSSLFGLAASKVAFCLGSSLSKGQMGT
jgi:hypothetical protein